MKRWRGMVLGLGVMVVLIVYLGLWSIDSEVEESRKEFDAANREAMEESAEWRYKYDLLLLNCDQVKAGLEKKMVEVGIEKNKLQKENIGLLARINSLTQELQTLRHKNSSL